VIDALVGGKVYGQPAQRTDKNGKPFATAKVRVATVTGDGFFVNVIAFARPAVDALLALADGDSVALSGELTPKIWTDKNGEARPALDLVAHAVLTTYHVSRKRQAIRNESEVAA
jgi:single-stranded DNA-binding protein